MTATVFPVDPVDTDSDGIPDFPTYAGRALRQVFGALIAGKTAARPLGSLSGVAPGTPTTTVTATPTTWTAAPHVGVLDKETAAEAGPYLYSFDAAVTRALVAADGSHDRYDLISVVVSDPEESDGSTVPNVDYVYTQGLAASTPLVPATPARGIPLAKILVPQATTGDPAVTWVGRYFAAAGGVLPVASSADYPSAPYEGQYVDDAALNCLMRWSGSAWEPFSRAVDTAAQVVQQPTGTIDIHTVSPTTYGTRTVTRPAWATHCIVQWNFVGIYEDSSTNGAWHLYGLVSSGTGNVGSGGVPITGAGDQIRFSVGWSERYSGLTDATITLTWGGFRGVVGANLRADTSTWLTASVIWLP